MNSAPPPTTGARCVLEYLSGQSLVGWACDPHAETEQFSASDGQEQTVALTGRRLPRADVRAALGFERLEVGFELPLPQTLFEELCRPGAPWQLCVNGVPVEGAELRALVHRRHLRSDGFPQSAVEERRGLCVIGWLADALQPMSLDLKCQEQTLGAVVRRVSRGDVAAAYGAEQDRSGFELDVPGSIWLLVPGQDEVQFELVAGSAQRPLGPALSLKRSELLTMVSAPWMRSAEARCLLAEHLLLSGAWPDLDETVQAELEAELLAQGVAVQDVLAGRSDAVAPTEVPEQTGLADPEPPWLSDLIQDPEVAQRMLSLLLRAKSRPHRLELARFWEELLTSATGLFDPGFYQQQCGEADLGPAALLSHYVELGDARSLAPNLLFSPGHYTRHLPGKHHPGVNRLLHYALVGRFHGWSPSPWLDNDHYLKCNVDVAEQAIEPLRHFLAWGWREGRSPVPGFQAGLATFQSPLQRLGRRAAGAGLGSVLDYLLRGLPAGLPMPHGRRLPWVPLPRLEGRDYLEQGPWAELPVQDREQALVDVIVPVYSGAQETLACLWSVLTAPVKTPFELVVIDDCSPDPALSQMLVWLAERGLIRLRVNAENLGFVASVNAGLAEHPDRDVVLLNADTQVFNNWLDRLLDHLEQQPEAASVTPLSNNATICSYPRTLVDNGPVSAREAQILDALAAEVNRGFRVTAPTGVGFCMVMRRRTLDAIGSLDVEAFGRGYGEENDWCQRAAAAGWRNVLAGDVFVSHLGSVSFADESGSRSAAAQQILAQRYPEYAHQVTQHIAADPLLRARVALDVCRLLHATQGHSLALLISHDRGGGTARHENERAQALLARDVIAIRVRPSTQPGAVALLAPEHLPLANLSALPLVAYGLLFDVVRMLAPTEVQVHQLVDLPISVRELLPTLCAEVSAPLEVVVHDYHLICPRINLVDASGRYCGEPDRQTCNQCLRSDGLASISGPILKFRTSSYQLLSAASRVVVPDPDVAERLMRYFPSVNVDVVPHEANLVIAPPCPALQAVRRVVVVGALGLIKGYQVVLDLANSRAAQELGLEITLLGYSMDDERLREAGVQVLGRYDDADLLARLEALQPDLVFLPSVWPETYSYVLSSVLRTGLRAAVFDLGAQARRLRAADVPCTILPLELAADAEALAHALVNLN